jgi:hypothetical protein
MAITDYSTLQSTISRWVGGSSDTQFAESIRDAIMLAEDEMNATLRVPEMIKRASTTIDEKYENLPPDCLELINVWRVADDYEVPLGYQPTSNIVAAGRLSGLPRWCRGCRSAWRHSSRARATSFGSPTTLACRT